MSLDPGGAARAARVCPTRPDLPDQAAAVSARESVPCLAFLIHNLGSGGVQRMTLVLAESFVARGVAVDLLVIDAQGELADQVPAGVNLIVVGQSFGGRAWLSALRAGVRHAAPLTAEFLRGPRSRGMFCALPALVRYVRTRRPSAMLTAMPELNMVAALARRRAGAPFRLVLSERTHLSASIAAKKRPADRSKRARIRLLRSTYLDADAIVAVSDGVADDLAARLALPRDRITTIYNPVIGPDFAARLAEPLDDPWFADPAVPVVLGVGRLSGQKDFPTLVRAFATLRARRPARLVIIGDAGGAKKSAKRGAELTGLAEALGIARDFRLLGFQPNPLPFMARAGVFALSSSFEGFGNVLVEALGAGCPVVSTDCPSGPAEILDHGRYGWLVPVGDHKAMAEAILAALEHPPPRARLMRRAAEFDLAHAMARYLPLLLDEDADARR